MKKTDTRAFVPPLPLARPTASRTQAFRATALREVRRRPPTVVRPGMFVPHFSQRRTVSRGACICSSASRSRRRFPTAAAAPPAPALPIARWRTGLIIAAPFGSRTRFPRSRRCISARRRPRPIHSVALGLIYNGVSSRSLRHPSAADRDFHSAGGVLRHADARGGFRPANAAHTLPHFFPTCDVQEANLFI